MLELGFIICIFLAGICIFLAGVVLGGVLADREHEAIRKAAQPPTVDWYTHSLGSFQGNPTYEPPKGWPPARPLERD